MKTIKIENEVHQKLIELQSYNYKKDGKKLTISQTIETLIIFLDAQTNIATMAKKQYNFNDGEH